MASRQIKKENKRETARQENRKKVTGRSGLVYRQGDCGCELDESEMEFTLIDGHNRLEICQRLGIPFDTKPMQFDSRNAVKLWIINNQRGRRNLTDGWKYRLAQTRKAILLKVGSAKLSEAGKEGNEKRWHKSPLSIVDKPDNDKPAQQHPKTHSRGTGLVYRQGGDGRLGVLGSCLGNQ